MLLRLELQTIDKPALFLVVRGPEVDGAPVLGTLNAHLQLGLVRIAAVLLVGQTKARLFDGLPK